MNSLNCLESDLRRAVFSLRFLAAAALQLAVLCSQGFGSTLYKMSVPLACALPYACGWLNEYQSGFVRLALPRSTLRGYVLGKLLASVLSGGGVEALAAWLFTLVKQQEPAWDYALIFLCGALWAAVAALLAAVSNSRYLAYGGAFVVFYFLVILSQRYWKSLYCLDPCEWLAPQHAWPFGNTGVMLLLLGLLAVLGLWYCDILYGRVENG